MRIFGIDAGKDSGKIVTGELSFKFRMKMNMTKELEASKGSHVIQYKGESYLIGADATGEDYDVSKEKLIHKMAVYLGIGKHVQYDERVAVVMGCPWSIFKEQDMRERYRDYMMQDTKVNVAINGDMKRFSIKEMLILPENIGIVHLKPQLFKDRLRAVIDIGGLNTNGVIYDNRKPILQTAFTLNEGGHILFAKIKNKLNGELGRNYQDYEIPYIIKQEQEDDTTEIVGSIMQEHIDKINNEMKALSWNVDGLDILFTGGGSILLKSAISNKFKNVEFSDNPVWDNAKGFAKIGGLKYGSKKC